MDITSDLRSCIIDPVDINFVEHLKCKICWDYFEKPLITCDTNNECIFCSDCINDLVYQKDAGNEFTLTNCPRCFRDLHELGLMEHQRKEWIESLKINKTINTLVNYLLSKCPHCEMKMNYSDLNCHLQVYCERLLHKCDFCELNIPGLKVKSVYEKHIASDCTIKCGRCGSLILTRNAKKHEQDCDFRELFCISCNKTIYNRDLEIHLRTLRHLEKTLSEFNEAHINKERTTLVESLVVEKMVNFERLVGKRIAIDFFGGCLKIGVSNEKKVYYVFDKRKSQKIPFVLGLVLVNSDGANITLPKTVLNLKKCHILIDTKNDYSSVSTLLIKIVILM